MAEDKDIQDGKIFAAIGYLTILCFLPLLLKRENAFALFHAKQGLVLFLGEIALFLIFVAIPILGWIIWYFGVLIFGIFSLMGIIQALKGKCWRMPVVATFADKFNI